MPKVTRALIDLSAIEANVRAVQVKIGAGVEICAPVKANAYGHGAIPVAQACVRAGATLLAVATPAEAFELREAMPESRILMFGGILAEDVAALVKARVELTVSDARQLDLAAAAARRSGMRAAVHVNVDTGMGRVGVLAGDSVRLTLDAARRPQLRLASVYTHFPESDEADRSFAREQISRFTAIVKETRAATDVPLAHMANSGGVLDLPESYMDMVRPGIMLYGYYPAPASSRSVPVRAALKLVSRLTLVRDIPPGWPISYGRTFTTRRRTRLGVVSAGYADGLSRRLSNAGSMIVRGRVLPIIGRVCMDLTMLDLTELPGAEAGDEVIVYSDRRADPNSVENVAQLTGTIPQDVVCAVSARVERVCHM